MNRGVAGRWRSRTTATAGILRPVRRYRRSRIDTAMGSSGRRRPRAGRKEGRCLQFEVHVEQLFFRIECRFLDGLAFRPARAILLGFGFPFRVPGFETVRV